MFFFRPKEDRFVASAAKGRTIELEGKLERYGISVDATNSDGLTALMAAVLYNRRATVNALLKLKCDVNLARVKPKCTSTDHFNGFTALMLAVELKRTDIIEDLVNAGANIDIRNPKGQNAIDIAKNTDQSEIERYLRNRHYSKNYKSREIHEYQQSPSGSHADLRGESNVAQNNAAFSASLVVTPTTKERNEDILATPPKQNPLANPRSAAKSGGNLFPGSKSSPTSPIGDSSVKQELDNLLKGLQIESNSQDEEVLCDTAIPTVMAAVSSSKTSITTMQEELPNLEIKQVCGISDSEDDSISPQK